MNGPSALALRAVAWATRQLLRAAKGAWAFARRRPAIALILAGVTIPFLPLAVDLLNTIPWPVRKGVGWLAFFSLLVFCAERLWQVRPGDDMPPADTAPARGWAWLLPLATCLVMAVPYLQGPRNLGFGDWDLNLSKYEAVRRTILEWGQFPWWDPWCRGGFPLAANPQCGVIGVATPLVLALGTSVGMRIAQLVCLLIAMEGARRLAQLWIQDPLAAAAAGVIYGINGSVLAQSLTGYHVPMTFCTFPWLLYHAFRLDRRPADGAWLGFWTAFNVLNGINYYNVYAILIVAVVWLRAARARTGPARVRFILHTVLALGVFLALAGWRMATTGLVYRDFPRPYRSGHDMSPWTILMNLLTRPNPEQLAELEVPAVWEHFWYVGPLVVVLTVLSLRWGWRWWHTLIAACVWLAAGSIAWYHPSYWLLDLPLFTTMHVVPRWRMMAMLGFALATADVLAHWRQSDSRRLHQLAVVVVALVATDYTVLGCQLLPLGFRLAPLESRFPGPPIRPIAQVRVGIGFAAIQRGYGVIALQEPLLGYDFAAPTERLWLGHRDYVGEFWTKAGPVYPRVWSPNRIVLDVEPGQIVFVNQNPGSWWWLNGRQAFADWRCAETQRVFAVQADSRGCVELRIRPRGLKGAMILHLAGMLLIGVAIVAIRRWKNSEVSDELKAESHG